MYTFFKQKLLKLKLSNKVMASRRYCKQFLLSPRNTPPQSPFLPNKKKHKNQNGGILREPRETNSFVNILASPWLVKNYLDVLTKLRFSSGK